MVECELPKLGVAGSSPVARSNEVKGVPPRGESHFGLWIIEYVIQRVGIPLPAFFWFNKMLQNKPEELSKNIESIITPICEDYGYEVVLVKIFRDPRGMVLRIMLDKEGGITLGDCARMSKYLERVLEVESLISGSFNLEISSPGIERPLVKKKDYIKFKGETIKIRTKIPFDNRKNFSGVLGGIEGEDIILDMDGRIIRIPLESVSKVNLKYKFT